MTPRSAGYAAALAVPGFAAPDAPERVSAFNTVVFGARRRDVLGAPRVNPRMSYGLQN
jgi:hypothetical protein